MNQKRNVLRKITGISSVLLLTPNTWTRPIVSSVILPAHAQTSAVPAQTSECVPTLSDTIVVTPNIGAIIIDNKVQVEFVIEIEKFVGFQAVITAKAESLGSKGGRLYGTIEQLNADPGNFFISMTVTPPEPFLETTRFTSINLSVDYWGVTEGIDCELKENTSIPIDLTLSP